MSRYNKRLELDTYFIPHGWMEKLVAEQKIGGVFLVFVSGKTNQEIEEKTKKIKDFCKTL